MKMLATRYATQKPAQLKKQVAEIKHLSAPLKGLSLDSKLSEGDPLTAPILENWSVDEDKIRVRPGTKLIHTLAAGTPISSIIPYDGYPSSYLLASDSKLYAPNDAVLGTFGSDNWHWTAFSNLGELDYTIMVNGVNGVWSWDGGNLTDPDPIAATNLSKTNPAVITVAPADIDKFRNGQIVFISGATGTGLENANGSHLISSVGSPVNTFTLPGVDTSAGAAPQTTGVAVNPPGSIQQELVTAPSAAPWINPQLFDKTLSHMNRLWFADSTNLAVYYLPLQSKGGELKYLPLNSIFRHGGTIAAIATWTLDGGAGMDDHIVIFTSHGECVIYGGTDPDTDFSMTGVFHFDSPMSKHSVIQYGGDLYVLTATGVYAMSGMLRAKTAQSDKTDRKVLSIFWDISRVHRGDFGWQLLLDHHRGVMICNLPEGGQKYRQMVRFMPNSIWATWTGLPARCWAWLEDDLYFATDDGKFYRFARGLQSDDGQPILADVQFAWSSFKTPAIKHFRMVLPYIITDGVPKPYVDIQVDYDASPPLNQPDVSTADLGAIWDEATWDVDYWSQSVRQRGQWSGVGKLGRVGAPRIRVAVRDCTFSIAAVDVIFERGMAV